MARVVRSILGLTPMNPAQPAPSEQNFDFEQSSPGAVIARLLVEESNGFAIVALNPNGRMVTWNVGAERLFRFTKSEVIGEYFSRLFPPDHRIEGMPERELKTARESPFATDENWLMRKDGSVFWASGTTTALRDKTGALAGYVKMVRDASERKQLRAALRASEQQFKTAVAQIKDHAIFSTDTAGNITTWNTGCEDVFQFREAEVAGTSANGLFRSDERPFPDEEDPFRGAADNGASSVDRFLTRKNGTRFWATVIITAVRDPGKLLFGYTIVVRDLTERDRADRAIHSSIERLQLLSDTARNLLGADDPLTLLDRIYDRLVESFDLDCYFHFVKGVNPPQLKLRAFRGIEKEVADRLQTIALDSLAGGPVAEDLQPRAMADVQATTDPAMEAIRQLGVTAYVCYPLVANQKLAGILSFGSRRERAFSQDQQDLFSAIAHLFSETLARREVTVALTAREAQLRAVLEGAPSGLLILDDLGRVVMVNAQAERLFGYPRADLLCQSIERLLPSRGAPGSSVHFLRGILDEGSKTPFSHQRYEIVARRSDGSDVPLEVWFSAATEPKPGFIIAAFTDISERRKAEIALRENEKKLRFLNELGERTRALRDPVQIMAVITRMVGEHLGTTRCAYADVELDGEQFTIPQDYTVSGVPSSAGKYRLSLFGRQAQQAMQEGRTLILEDVDGEVPSAEAVGFKAIAVRAIICCPLVKEGRLHAMMAVHQDQPRKWSRDEIDLLEIVVERCWSTIERAKVEQSLLQNEERLKLAMDAGRLGMWHLDTLSGQATIDARVSEFYGLPRDTHSIHIDKLFERIHPDDRAIIRAALSHAGGGAHYDAEFRILHSDGSVRWIAGKGDMVLDSNAAQPTIIGVNYDLTARKKAEEELHAAQSALHRHAKDLESIVAERTSKLRETVAELERFSYSLSHDMRAPLRAMQGFAQIVDDEYGPGLDEVGRNYLRRITAAAGRLDQLIRDVLSYTHVVREDVRLEPLQVAPLLRQLIAENPALQPPLAEVVVESPLLPVMGHEAYLTQCLSNLLTNGVKFVAPRQKPLVRIWTEAHHEHVRLFVRDNGIGIPKEWQARIFGMFERMHPASHYDGTGIGLTIVRKAAERMGGLVGVDSESGRGSTFWIQLNKPPAH